MRRRLVGLLASLFLSSVSSVSAAPIVDYAPGANHTRIVVKMKAPTANVAMASATDGPSTRSILDAVSARLGSEVGPLFDQGMTAARASADDVNVFDEVKAAAEVLERYMSIPLPAGTSEQAVRAALADIKRQQDVDVVYAEPETLPAVLPADEIIIADPPLTMSTPNLAAEQTHLAAINQPFVTRLPGGKGDTISVIDIEKAWTINHEDLPTLAYNLNPQAWSDTQASRDHGTAVLGVIAARENGIGVNGIAPNALLGSSPYITTNNIIGQIGTAEAIKAAADVLKAGDVLLIESHRGYGAAIQCSCNLAQCGRIPLEFWDADFDAIQFATKKGISVVEAAGNGSVDLNQNPFINKLDRNYRDSGAIIVGASQASSRTPMCFSNSGSMVDVNAWGEKVVTTGYGDLHNGGLESKLYTGDFSGTSSASAIIAGSVASLQGLAKANLGAPLSPAKMRELLIKGGTSQTGELSRRIGKHVDLKASAELMLGRITPPLVPPTLLLLSHKDYQEITLNKLQRIVLKVKVQPSATIRTVTAKYLDRSVAMIRNADGSYSVSWNPRPLGKAQLSFTATDSKGSVNKLFLNLTVVR